MQDVYRLIEQKSFEDARQACERRLSSNPGDVEALYLLGTALRNSGDDAAAAPLLRRALLLAPDEAPIHVAYGLALRGRGEISSALTHLRRAAELDPACVPALVNLANLLFEQGALSAEVLPLLDQALAANPKHASVYVARGDLFWRLNRPEDAEAAYRKALELDPTMVGLNYRIATLLPVLPHSREEIQFWRDRLVARIEALEANPPPLTDPLQEVARTLFYVTYHGLNDREIQVRLANLYAQACPDLLFKSPHLETWAGPGAPIRLGFVSANLGLHTIGDLNRELIRGLPRELFHVTVFLIGPQKPGSVESIQACADETVSLPASLPGMRQVLADHKLDILHYPDIGMSPQTYFLAFSRLAPVQCVTWGHPETTGLPEMDYFLSMEDAEGPDSQDHYSETLVRLPTTVKVASPPPIDTKLTRADLGLPEEGALYACPQSAFKIHPDMDVLVKGILEKDPTGHVAFLGEKEPFWEAELRARFRAIMGEDEKRVLFLPRMPNAHFGALLRLADVLLDPPHFGGGKTTLEGLWAGTPVLALPSDFARARLTRAYSHQMGYLECLVDTPQAYVEKAVRLARDAAYAAQVRAAITEKRGVLFDNDAAITAHTAFFLKALERAPKPRL